MFLEIAKLLLTCVLISESNCFYFFLIYLLVSSPFKLLRLSLFSVDNQPQSRQVKLHISISIVKRIIFGSNDWIIMIFFTISFNMHCTI